MEGLPEFKTKKEEIAFIVKNKERLIAQKKSAIKLADNFTYPTILQTKEGKSVKANEPFTPDSDVFKIRAIINTTNLFDSHKDVHLPGLWKKSLQENKAIMHIQEHESRKFSHIISDYEDLKAYAKMMNWSELGASYDGETEALTFDSTIRRKRNEFMFDQYANGWVKQHSVGMVYVKLILGVNNEDYGAEFDAWEKYSPEIANLEDAEDNGYAWFVKEAKAIEGSAVPRGSNWITPTQENNLKYQPAQATDNNIEPSNDTQINYKYLLTKLKN